MYAVHYLVYSSIIAEVFNFFFFIPFIHKMCKLKAGGTNTDEPMLAPRQKSKGVGFEMKRDGAFSSSKFSSLT